MPPLRSAPRGLASSLLLVLTLATAGCSSGSGDRPAGKREGRPGPMPTLVGQQTFFEGRITAEIKVGALTGFKRPGGGERQPGESAPETRRGRRGGGGGGGGGFGGGMSGGDRPPGGDGSPGEAGEGPRAAGMRRGGPSGPPVAIHLRFTNHGSEPIELRIADFLSPLGNFVVQPEKLTLAAGASAEVDPMTSGIAGQMTGGEITLKLQIGTQRETKTVPLQVEERPGPGAS